MNTPVPFVALNREHAAIAPELHEAFARVVRGGGFILGEEVSRFEAAWAAACGAAHCVGVASGTAALTLLMRAAGIGRGDEVIVPAHTYVDIMGPRKPIVLRPWLVTIARHRCLTVIGARRAARVGSLQERPTPAFTLEVDVREDLRAVMHDIARLPEDQRVALVLREIGGASYAEIARILEAPPARVRTLVFQARSSLRTSRRAREIPCAEIRRTLAVSRGGALRRSELSHHLRQCEGCRACAAELRARRRGFKSLLPLGPLVALERTALGAFVTSSGGGGAALLDGGVAVTALVTIAVAGGGGVAGVAASGGPGRWAAGSRLRRFSGAGRRAAGPGTRRRAAGLVPATRGCVPAAGGHDARSRSARDRSDSLFPIGRRQRRTCSSL